MLSNCLGEVIRPLERISALRQFTFEVIAKVESARNIYKRHTFPARAKSWMYAQVRVCRIGKTVRCRHRHTRIRYRCRVLWVQKCPLALAEKCKARLIHRCRANGPRVTDVDLLHALIGKIAKSWQIRPARLKTRERLREIMLREVVVAAQMLVLRDFMIDLQRKLIRALVPQRHRLKGSVGPVRMRNELIQ